MVSTPTPPYSFSFFNHHYLNVFFFLLETTDGKKILRFTIIHWLDSKQGLTHDWEIITKLLLNFFKCRHVLLRMRTHTSNSLNFTQFRISTVQGQYFCTGLNVPKCRHTPKPWSGMDSTLLWSIDHQLFQRDFRFV